MAISTPIPLCISHFAPIIFLYLLLLPSTAAVNITTLLSPFPDLSDFSGLLSTTAVAGDLLRRNSITILAVPNSFLRSSALLRHPSAAATNLADVIRYHVLLQYLSPGDLRRLPPAGKLITTLLQTTGRSSSASVNLTHDAATDTTTVRTPTGDNNATVIAAVVTLPYNLTILTVDSLIIPAGLDLTASDSRPPLGINVTGTLIAAGGHNFNVAAAMLSASGVISEFESEKGGAGITLFVPTDDAFSNIPATENFQSLPADQKSDVLRFHVLLSYYPLGSLESIVNPFQPTLATEDKGAGTFTLNISRVNGSVAISTGIVEASVIQTVIDQNPIAIFGVSRVLLPKEIFGKTKNLVAMAAPPPVPELGGPPLSSPGVREEIRSPAAVVRNVDLGLYFCIGLVYYVFTNIII